MAEKRYSRAASPKSGNGRTESRAKRAAGDRDSYTYVDGNTVRQLHVATQPMETEEPVTVSHATRKNRERELQMNVGYVFFLTAAAVMTVFVCVNFLQLRATNTLLQEKVASLSAELDSAVLENDSEYNRVMNSVDLTHVKEVATDELGMQLATADQVVTYEAETNDYVRQYSEIPEE
ncbi:MAG: hypothetical protein LUD12_14870 [Lachnospiraceae bacterium]|nr:hypothetical protein [Lachnospiraceae bacterium]